MNKVISFLVNIALKKPMEVVNGKKAYIGAAGTMLGGAGMIATGAAALVAQFTALGEAGAILAWAKALPQDEAYKLILQGIAAIGGGFSVLGVRHAIEKNEVPVIEAKDPEPKP